MSEQQEIYARLYPYNPRKGFLVQKHSHRSNVYVGGPRPNWYRVSPELARELETKTQAHDDPDSKPLFQVVNAEQKARIEAGEQQDLLQSLGVVGKTLAGTRDVAPPPTVDLRPEVQNQPVAPMAPPVPVPNNPTPLGVGRAAALPPPREQLRTENAAGAITSEDAMATRRGAVRPDERGPHSAGE